MPVDSISLLLILTAGYVLIGIQKE